MKTFRLQVFSGDLFVTLFVPQTPHLLVNHMAKIPIYISNHKAYVWTVQGAVSVVYILYSYLFLQMSPSYVQSTGFAGHSLEHCLT